MDKRRIWVLAGRTLLAVVVLLLVVGFLARDRIERLLAVNSLFSADLIVQNFSHMDSAFLTKPVPIGPAPVSPLPRGAAVVMPAGTNEWIAARNVTALVVLKDGQLVHEDYFLGTGPDDLRISWSVAKSLLSALMGIEVDEGKIASIDDQVTKYVPALLVSAYAGATIRNVMNMASGVRFNEDYLDFNSDINKMGRTLALGMSMDGFAESLHETGPLPGEVWQYVSIDTHVLGMVVRGATGRDIPGLMSEKLIVPMGLEAEPYYITDGYGVAFVLGGLNMRTRDYARFGQMYLDHGAWNGHQIVPADWVAASTTPSAPTAPGAEQYGYQWWIPADAAPGEYFARGIYGQYIYVNSARGVVIAVNAADRGFQGAGVEDGNIAMFRKIAERI